ncbi:hypothetical protein HBI77_064680 [Parastagonospora nodorum]|nr:hypothetical protein HBH78_090720 [Parastagonospora nodorum]KAH4796843.1 hypothetical protein HBH63_081670 [Parastagonospora nodorum]KAH5015763.1 hypothetical protein HBI77_064680 [Parastagonospora nodorum]
MRGVDVTVAPVVIETTELDGVHVDEAVEESEVVEATALEASGVCETVELADSLVLETASEVDETTDADVTEVDNPVELQDIDVDVAVEIEDTDMAEQLASSKRPEYTELVVAAVEGTSPIAGIQIKHCIVMLLI